MFRALGPLKRGFLHILWLHRRLLVKSFFPLSQSFSGDLVVGRKYEECVRNKWRCKVQGSETNLEIFATS